MPAPWRRVLGLLCNTGILVLAAATLLATACKAGPRSLPGMPPETLDRTGGTDPGRPARTVVLVSVDGLAPWVLEGTETPTLDELVRTGAAASWAETVTPSRTLPSHASMISGLEPDRHGVDWNAWQPWRRVAVPTLFARCREARLRCGLFAGKAKLAHFAVGETGVERYRLAGDARAVLDAALGYLDEREPHFVMIHLAEVDLAGHRDGWGSEAQRGEIRRIDRALGEFLDEARDELEGRLAVIVTADHGGHGRGHGGGEARDLAIPWIAWGSGVPAGIRLARVRTVDTAATVLGLLGLPTPAGWLGKSHFPFYLASDPAPADGSATGGGQ